MNNFIFALSSIGFVGRFFIAFVILAFLYSRNREDIYLRKGFKILCIAGAVVFVLLVLLLILGFVLGGIGLLGGLFNSVQYSYHYSFPY